MKINGLVSLSVMPSLLCDLECPHCMYEGGPTKFGGLDTLSAAKFMASVDWTQIGAFGLYGGEPSLWTGACDWALSYVPPNITRFCITNGAWSTDKYRTLAFMQWAVSRGLLVFVSSTPYHILKQDLEVLADLSAHGWVTMKPDDTAHRLLPMGRAAATGSGCDHRCLDIQRETRIAVKPDGKVIFQTCGGVYPEIGHISFANYKDVMQRVEVLRSSGC